MPSDWRLERTISLGDLLLFLSLSAAGVGFIVSQEARQVKLETETVDTRALTDARFTALTVDLTRIQAQTDRMERKLDSIGGHPSRE